MSTRFQQFTKVFIISSIGNGIEDTEQRQVAPSLCQAFDVLNCSLSQHHKIQYQHFKIACDADWENAWKLIYQECRQGCKPIVHFVCHGEERPLYDDHERLVAVEGGLHQVDNTTDKLRSWRNVAKYLEEASILCRNNLLSIMCVCYGFFSLIDMFNPQHRLPCFALISSPDAISTEEANTLLPNFYSTLFSTGNIDAAYGELKKWNASQNTSSRWLLSYADKEFVNNMIKDYIRHRSTLYRIRQTAKKAIKQAYRKILIKQVPERLIRFYIGENFKQISSIYEKIRDFQFMFDIYPQERDRFDIPNTYADIRALARSRTKKDNNEP